MPRIAERWDAGTHSSVKLPKLGWHTLAQRVEVGDREVRIMGSKTDLLRTLTAAGVKSAAGGVRSSVLSGRKGREFELDIDRIIRFSNVPKMQERR